LKWLKMPSRRCIADGPKMQMNLRRRVRGRHLQSRWEARCRAGDEGSCKNLMSIVVAPLGG
jgi:hypothetical protein